MAVTRTARGTATSKTSGTTLQIAAQSLNIGDLLVVYIAYDDVSMSSVFWGTQALTLGISALGAGVRTRMAWCVADATASRAITATWDSALVAKAMVADSFRSSVTGGGQTWFTDDVQAAQATGLGTNATTAATGAITGGTESATVGIVGTEGPSGDTTGTWNNPATNGQRVGTTGNPAQGNVTVSSAYTLGPTAGTTPALSKVNMTSRDWGANIRHFWWAVPPSTVGGSFTADAIIRNSVAGSFTADAVIRNSVTGSFTADAVLSTIGTGSFTADAILLRAEAGSFDADAVISSIVSGSFTLDAEIGAFVPAGASWVAPPADAEVVSDTTPTFTFNMPPAAMGDMYFEIHLDTVSTFDSGNLLVYRSYPDATGWEYYNGTAWTPMPASGVPVAHAGRQGRFTVPSPLSNTTWFRRVRASV